MTDITASSVALAGNKAPIEEILAQLRDNKEGIPLVDLMATAENLVGSMHTIFSALDTSIFREFGSIAGSITRARDEIGRLQPHDITEEHIPGAGKELQAIVTATEDATHTIMEASEAMLEMEATDLETYKTEVEAQVMRIFEACSFQDITGQRVSKIVETLEDIDERVGRIASAFGATPGTGEKTDRELKRDARKEDQILHGPALDGEGVNQDDIDQMLSEDQSAIDALFD